MPWFPLPVTHTFVKRPELIPTMIPPIKTIRPPSETSIWDTLTPNVLLVFLHEIGLGFLQACTLLYILIIFLYYGVQVVEFTQRSQIKPTQEHIGTRRCYMGNSTRYRSQIKPTQEHIGTSQHIAWWWQEQGESGVILPLKYCLIPQVSIQYIPHPSHISNLSFIVSFLPRSTQESGFQSKKKRKKQGQKVNMQSQIPCQDANGIKTLWKILLFKFLL